MSNPMFYDQRWQGLGVSQAERDRVAFTLAAVPTDCSSVLDVGAGDGRLSHLLADQGYRVTAVDISPVALAKLRVPSFLRSSDDLQFADHSFDLVLCTEILEHLPADVFERSVREIARVADRYVLVTIPNDEALAENLATCRCGHRFHMWGHLVSVL